MKTLDEIREEALALDMQDRALLIEDLLESMDPGMRQRVDAAWAMEAERRITAHERGETRTVSIEEIRHRFGIA